MAEATDNARAKAEELGVDIEEVEGTGQDGRVIVSDVEAFASSAEPQAEPQAEAQAEPEPAPLVTARLNPSTQLGGYGFEDGFSVFAGKTYPLSEDEYKKYSKVKRRDKQVLVKV